MPKALLWRKIKTVNFLAAVVADLLHNFASRLSAPRQVQKMSNGPSSQELVFIT